MDQNVASIFWHCEAIFVRLELCAFVTSLYCWRLVPFKISIPAILRTFSFILFRTEVVERCVTEFNKVLEQKSLSSFPEVVGNEFNLRFRSAQW